MFSGETIEKMYIFAFSNTFNFLMDFTKKNSIFAFWISESMANALAEHLGRRSQVRDPAYHI